MSAPRKRLAMGLGLGLVASGLLVAPPPAQAVSTGLVISEAYGGGGNTGASWSSDFIELYNPTSAPIPVDGMSVQYRSATNRAGGVTPLSGSVPAKGYYLVQQASGTTVTDKPLPQPDARGTIAMSGSAGIVFLAQGTAPLTPASGDSSGTAGVVDLVGWGSATVYEGTAPAPGTTNSTSVGRSAPDGDRNHLEFTAGAPTPQNSGAGTPEPEPEPGGVRSIAEIQGTGARSPLVGQEVTTEGVVTAAYPTGGFKGFYLQTGGEDGTPGASDGLFVYAPSFSTYPALGESVRVTGTVGEHGTLTQVTAASAASVQPLTAPQPPVVPLAAVPGTGCVLPGTTCLTGAALDAAREEHEGELVRPTGPYTVTDVYDGSAYNGGSNSSGMFGEIGLAAELDEPLVTPTEVVDAQDTAARAARTAFNDAHRVILDDGSSTNYASAANRHLPFPWLTKDHTVRVGAAVTFDAPLVLDYRFGWKLQPQRQVVGRPTGLVTFEQDRPQAPAEVGGDVTLATFNVLNYFTTLGVDVPGCTPYTDRAGDGVTVRSCSGDNGPRGAWDAEDFARQQTKIVASINALDADVVSLEEIENSLAVDGHDRDEAVAALVRALNADAGERRWDYVRSPKEVPAAEDVIRSAFIYDPRTVRRVGASEILLGSSAFDNAREPLAQAFTAIGGRNRDAFAVIANHFKSKGSGTPDPHGQGNANDSRVAQAQALVDFADRFAAARRISRVFLAGDFNAYSEEDPVQLIEAAGYTSLHSTDDPDEESYSFNGTVGSLDHVFANAAALPEVTGVDVWTTNAYESVYHEYSRHNANVTDLYVPGPFRASDHNPEIVGIDVPRTAGPDGHRR